MNMMGLYSSGALGGVEVLEAGVGLMPGAVAGELHAHVLGAQAAAHAAAAAAAVAAHHQHQTQQQIKTSPSSGRSTPVSVVTTVGGGAVGAAGGAVSGGSTSPSPSKLFVGGLSWQTSSEKLREYFAMFGPVTDVLIMKDPVTQRSRGFGFITFQEASAVDKVLAVPVHTLDGKRIDPKHATPKSRPAKTKKIFVGGVGQDTSAEEVRTYFAQFGHVEDTVMLMDQQTKRHRGFGFVTFHSEEAVERVCEIHFHTIKNKKVECKRAQPKEAVAAAAAPLTLGKRLVLRPGRGLVYGTPLPGMPGVQTVAGATHAAAAATAAATAAYRYAPYALPAGAAALVAPPAPAPQAPLPQFGTAYSLAGMDMSSFQSVDWAAMYGLGMYI